MKNNEEDKDKLELMESEITETCDSILRGMAFLASRGRGVTNLFIGRCKEDHPLASVVFIHTGKMTNADMKTVKDTLEGIVQDTTSGAGGCQRQIVEHFSRLDGDEPKPETPGDEKPKDV